MPNLRNWIDSFFQLARLRDFLTGRATRIQDAARPLAKRLGRAARPLTAWLRARPGQGMDDEKAGPVKLELQPMDWRNPPSENIAQTALPLAATAAAAAATVYFAATLEAHDRSVASTVAAQRLGGYDSAPPGIPAVTLDPDPIAGGSRPEELVPRQETPAAGAPDESHDAAVTSVDGAGSTLHAIHEDDFQHAGGGGGSAGGSQFVDSNSGVGGGGGSGGSGLETSPVGTPLVENRADANAASTGGASGAIPGTSVPLASPPNSPNSTAPTHPPSTSPPAFSPPTPNPGTNNLNTLPAAPPSGVMITNPPAVPPVSGPRPLPLPVIFAGSGSSPVVNEYDAQTGVLIRQIQAFDSAPHGVVVAAGDFTRDGYPDVAVVPASGGSPQVRVFDGKTGTRVEGPLGGFTAFDSTVKSGVRLAAADVTGDMTPDLIAAAVTATGPEVRVFDGRTAKLVTHFAVASADFTGGLSVAAADLTGDGRAEVAVGAGPGGAAMVRVYDPMSGTRVVGPLGEFRAFATGKGGVEVGSDALAGDMDADGTPDLAVGTGPGSAPRVRVFSGKTGEVLLDFAPFGPAATGGVRVGLAYVTDDPFADVVVGTGPGVPAKVRVFDGETGQRLQGTLGEYHPFGNATSGVYIAAANDPEPVGVTVTTLSTAVQVTQEVSVIIKVVFPEGAYQPIASIHVDWIGGFAGNGGADNSVMGDSTWVAKGYFMSPGHGTVHVNVSGMYYDDESMTELHSIGGEFELQFIVHPLPPEITDFDDDTGGSGSDRVTYDTTPYVSGTARPADEVTVYQRGPVDARWTALGTVTADWSGLWTYALDTAQGDGTYFVTAAVTNWVIRSAMSAPLTYVLDTTPPDLEVSVASFTYSTAPRITVTTSDLYGPTGATTITLDADLNNDGDYSDANETGYATAALSGGVAKFVGSDLGPGTATRFRARATDLAGNVGTSPDASVVVLPSPVADGPAAPAITGFASDTGYADDDGLTYDTTPTLSGTSVANATITVYRQRPGDFGPTPIGKTTASGGGAWSFTVPTVLSDATYCFTATATVSGRTSGFSDPVTVLVDATAPNLSLYVNSPTSDTQPLVSVFPSDLGGFPELTTVTLDVDLNNDNDYADAGETGYASATLSGVVASFSGYSPLSGGTYHFRARAIDLAGNEGISPPVTVQILSPPPPPPVPPSPPAFPTITGILDDTGESDTDGVTYDTTPTLFGTAPSDGTFTLYSWDPIGHNFIVGFEVVSSGGLWTFPLDPAINPSWSHQFADALTARGYNTFYPSRNGTSSTTVFVDPNPPILSISPMWETSTSAMIAVRVMDAWGTESPATVTFDVDINNDGDFIDAGESGYVVTSFGSPIRRYNSIDRMGNILFSGLLGRTFRVRARLTDPAGNNEGVSNTIVLHLLNSASDSTAQKRSTYAGMPNWTTPQDSLAFAGDVTAMQSLDVDASPNAVRGSNPSLIYHSQEASPAPVVQMTILSDNAMGVPSAVTGILTWDGSVVATVVYDTSALTPGSHWVFAAAPPPGASTGRHTYTLDLFFDYPGTDDDFTRGATSSTFVVNRSSGPYGAGWSFSDTDALVTISEDGDFPAGVLREFGNGGWGFYEQTGTYTYDSPPGDEGVLVGLLGGGWTYTGYYGEVLAFNSAGQMTSWTSPNSVDVVTYTYDGSGGVATIASPDGTTSTLNYSGNLLQTINQPGGRATTLSHSSADLTGITNPAGDVHTFAYASHRLTGEAQGVVNRSFTYTTGGLAQTVQLGSDPVGTIVAALTAGLGAAVNTQGVAGQGTYGYGVFGYTVPGSVTNGNGAVTRSWYNEFGQLTYKEAASGAEEYFSRTSDGWVVLHRNSQPHEYWDYIVNNAGQVLNEAHGNYLGQSRAWDYSGPNHSLVSFKDFNGNVWTYTNDEHGQRTSETDPLGHTTTYTWDNGLLVRVLNAAGEMTTYLYDANRRPAGQVVEGVTLGTENEDDDGYSSVFTDALSHTTTVVNDDMGRPVTVTDPNGFTTTSVYDASGLLLYTIDPLNVITSYGYDGAGRRTVEVDAYGTDLERRTTWVYDSVGRLIATVDPLNHRTTNVYDVVDRLIATVDALGNRVTFSYNNTPGPSTMMDPYGRLTTYRYDLRGRQIGMTDPLQRTTWTTYDNMSNVIRTFDAKGKVVTYVYDKANQLIETINENGDETEYEYDEVGRMENVEDGNDNDWDTVYDDRGRLSYTEDEDGNRTTYTYDDANRLIAVTDPNGRTTTTIYDNAGHVIATIDPRGKATTTVYDKLGRVIATVDPLNHRSTIVYDALGRVWYTVDPLGFRTTNVYDAADRLIATIDPLNNRTTNVYDALNRVIAILDPTGGTTSYDYDLLSNLIQTTDPLGRASNYAVNAEGEVVGETNGEGDEVETVYDANGREVAEVDDYGNRTTTVYDDTGYVIATIDPSGDRTTYGYDDAGNRVTVTDPYLRVTTSVYDYLNRQVEEIDPYGKHTAWVYDKAGQLIATVDPLGNRTTYLYDADGRDAGTINPDGYETEVVYDDAGRLWYTVDEDEQVTTYAYDNADRLIAVTDPEGRTTTTVYDAASRVIATIDPSGKSTTYGYDAMGRQVSVTNPLSKTFTTVYDKSGAVLATIDAKGFRTTNLYDLAGRLSGGIDALGKRTTTVYDDAGRVWVTVDELGFRTTNVYDSDSRVIATIDPRNYRTTYGYDKNNNLVSVTDPNNHTTTTVYDDNNRVIATVDALNHRTTTVYDDDSRVIATVDPLGNRTTYGYDRADRVVSVTDSLNKTTTTVYDEVGRVIATVDPFGRATTTVYDEAGYVIATIDPLNGITATQYDAEGRVWATLDPLGNITTYVYDDADQLIATVDSMGNFTSYAYDDNGQQVSTTDALNRLTSTTYDALGRVTGTTDGLGQTSYAVYDAAGRTIATIDELGKRTTYGYDKAGNPVTVTDPLNKTTTTTYDPAGYAIATIDRLGNTTSYGYDAVGRPVSVTNPQGVTTTTIYDIEGKVWATVDSQGNVTTYNYDANDRLVSVTDPLNQTTTSVYDDAGRLIATIDELGNVTTYGYDYANRRVSVTDPLNQTTTTVYDFAGRVVATVDARGNVTTNEYDAFNRQTAVVNPLGQRTTFVYDNASQRIAVIDPLGQRTTSVYDDAGRVIATVDSSNHRTTTVYDFAGRVIATVDALGNRATMVYDFAGRMVATVDPLGFRTTSVYDASGNRTVLVDASGNRTTWVYDSLSRVISETDPLNQTATFAYDVKNRVVSQTDRLGRRRDFSYDSEGRVLTETWYAVGGSLVQTQTWTYDVLGRMLSAQDPDGTYTFAYDAAGQLTRVDEPFGLVLTMGYDQAGNRTRVEDSLGGVTTVTFDTLNRQLSEGVGGSGVSAMRFDRAYTLRGQLESVARFSDLAGTTTVALSQYEYDDAGRLTHLVQRNGSGAILANSTYTFDNADRLDTKVEDGTTTSFGYDIASQLTQDGASTFGYDATGNRTNAGYVTGVGNRLESDGVSTFTYDANGNLIQSTVGSAGATWTYTYDHRNQLVGAMYASALGGSVTQRVTFGYDAFGVRISRQAWDGTSTTTTHYGVDGWDPAKPGAIGNEGFDTIIVLDGSNTLQARYAYGPGFNEVVTRQSAAGAVNWQLADYQGSVRMVIDNSATVLATTSYSAFGKVTGGAVDGFIGYAGYTWDATLQLWVTQVRVYNPQTGRFLQQDMLGFAAGDPNLFRYVKNNPANATDPSGMYLKVATNELDKWIALLGKDNVKVSDKGTAQSGFEWTKIELTAEAKRNKSLYEKVRKYFEDTRANGYYSKLYNLFEGEQGNIPDGRHIFFVPTQTQRDGHRYAALYEFANFPGADVPSTSGGSGQIGATGTNLHNPLVQMHAAAAAPGVIAPPPGYREVIIGSTGIKQQKNDLTTMGVLLRLPFWAAEGLIQDLSRDGGKGVERQVTGMFYTEAAPVGRVWQPMEIAAYQYYPDPAWGDLYSDTRNSLLNIYFTGISAMVGGIGSMESRAWANMSARLATPPARFAPGSTMKGGFSTTPSVAERMALEAGGCFGAGTPLLTPSGGKPIEEFAPGDLLLSRDEHDLNGVVTPKTVEEVFTHFTKLIRVHAGGQVIGTTEGHPFWVQGKGWLPARELITGDRFVGHDGQETVVEKVVDPDQWAVVYNLRIADFHTYFVGCDEWGFSVWAHNACVGILDTGIVGPDQYILVQVGGHKHLEPVLHGGKQITGATRDAVTANATKLTGVSVDDITVGTLYLQKPHLRNLRPPTGQHSVKLAENLEREVGPRPKPTPTDPNTYTAAHLVPTSDQAGRSAAVQQAVEDAKAALLSAGIDGDAAINGFWTNHPTQFGTSNDKYFLELGKVMNKASREGGNAVEQALKDLLVRVKAGEFVK